MLPISALFLQYTINTSAYFGDSLYHCIVAQLNIRVPCLARPAPPPSHARQGLGGLIAPRFGVLDGLIHGEDEGGSLRCSGERVQLHHCRLPNKSIKIVHNVFLGDVNSKPLVACKRRQSPQQSRHAEFGYRKAGPDYEWAWLCIIGGHGLIATWPVVISKPHPQSHAHGLTKLATDLVKGQQDQNGLFMCSHASHL